MLLSLYFHATLPLCCLLFPPLFASCHRSGVFFVLSYDLHSSSPRRWLRDFVQKPFTSICTLDHLADFFADVLPPSFVGVTVCVKPPLCRRSSQCDRSSGPKGSSCSKSVVGVCEINGKIGEEANKGRRDMTRGWQLFQDTKLHNPRAFQLEPRVFA